MPANALIEVRYTLNIPPEKVAEIAKRCGCANDQELGYRLRDEFADQQGEWLERYSGGNPTEIEVDV